LKCDRCTIEEHVKKIIGFGKLCYKCFDEMVIRMLEFQDAWLSDTIVPAIKKDISDGIMKDGEHYDVHMYIKQSIYDIELINTAINEMFDGGSLPEIVRTYLNNYLWKERSYIEDMDFGDDDG
jgi:hypothetical protein